MGCPQVAKMTAGSQRKKAAQVQARMNNVNLLLTCRKGSQFCRRCGMYGHNKVTCLENKNL